MPNRAERDVNDLLEKLLKIYCKEGGIDFNQISEVQILKEEEVRNDKERQELARKEKDK